MTTKQIPTVAALAACGVLALTGTAGARGEAETTVTIKEEASGDFFGVVKSSDAAECAEDRKVTLYKQRGSEPKPQEDKKVASDNASFQGGKYRWSTGNTNQKGKVYARAGKIDGCKGDLSKTIRSSA